MTISVCSYGGGVQSTALLVLAARGELDIKTFLFANVGDDSEHPATLRYVREVAMPYASQHGITIIELHYTKKDGTKQTLLENITMPSQKGEVIPIRLGSGKPGIRACTTTWKIRTIGKWMRAHGASKAHPGVTAIGISLDEIQRMKPSQEAYRVNVYPLIDRRMNRQDCINVIARAGLPVPPKSSCFFCPFHRMSKWQEMAKEEPVLFQKSVDLEQFINERRVRLGKDRVYLTDKLIPLDRAIGKQGQNTLFEVEPCDSGFCFL